ncbi:MAG: hypothetical protein GY930_02130 [bacterium]|nr:hypothetical protein [bacterium]
MTTDFISVIDAAARLGRNKEHLFKVLKRLGIEPTKQKSSGARGQRISYLSREQLELLKNEVGTSNDQPTGGAGAGGASGVFYLIQLEPDHDPGRFKLGFASSIDERLRAHRTAAPLCQVVETWPSKHLWEKTAIDSIARGCERLHTEVFRTDSIAEIEERGKAFFTLMPEVE